MVMPRSRSRSLESITRSTGTSFSRKMPLWLSMASTSVVLPWSTCAMMAMLRMAALLFFMNHVYRVQPRSDTGRIQSGEHGVAPNQQESARQQFSRGVKLNGPAKALLVDYVYQEYRKREPQ